MTPAPSVALTNFVFRREHFEALFDCSAESQQGSVLSSTALSMLASQIVDNVLSSIFLERLSSGVRDKLDVDRTANSIASDRQAQMIAAP